MSLVSFSAPLGENSMNPAANPFNSSAVVVSWSPPQTPQGNITRYVIYKYDPPSNTTAVNATEVPGSQMQGVVFELEPYTQYKFTVRACNSYGCSRHSPGALARTHPAGMYIHVCNTTRKKRVFIICTEKPVGIAVKVFLNIPTDRGGSFHLQCRVSLVDRRLVRNFPTFFSERRTRNTSRGNPRFRMEYSELL